jgi:Leucine-rich repeat (LRR) protein
LVKLNVLDVSNNKFTNLPESIFEVSDGYCLKLYNNQFTSLPKSILKLLDLISIDDTSYEINNLSLDCEFLILSELSVPLENLPCTIQTIWLNKSITDYQIKVPFGCKIEFF